MRVLVTGGNGYIGSRLIKKLDELDYCSNIYAVTRKGSKNERLPKSDKVSVVEYDGTIDSLVESVKNVDVVFHLGALYKNGKDSETVNNVLFSNIVFSSHLLQNISEHNSHASVVSASTFSFLDSMNKYSPNSFYDASKYAVEIIAEAMDIKIAFLRFPDTYGPLDHRKKVHNLLRDSVECNDKVFRFMKPDSQLMNLAHVDDIVRALIFTSYQLDASDEFGVRKYNLFYPENVISLGELSELIIEGSGTLVEFPIIGEVNSLPFQGDLLPGFKVEYDVRSNIREALFSRD